MSYADFEARGGRPVEIYHFQMANRNWYYTSSDEVIVREGRNYAPVPIERSEISVNEEARTNTITITMLATDGVTTQYKEGSPDVVCFVFIYRSQLDDSAKQWVSIFTGTVKDCSFSDATAVLNCGPTQDAIEHRLLSVVAQPLCNNHLYDKRCLVNKGAWTFGPYPITSFAEPSGFMFPGSFGSYVIVLGGTASTDFSDNGLYPSDDKKNPTSYINHGVVRKANHRSMVINHYGNVLYLLSPLPSAVVGDLVTVYAGCNKKAETCQAKFNNINRFLGFPFVPGQNPFGSEGVD